MSKDSTLIRRRKHEHEKKRLYKTDLPHQRIDSLLHARSPSVFCDAHVCFSVQHITQSVHHAQDQLFLSARIRDNDGSRCRAASTAAGSKSTKTRVTTPAILSPSPENTNSVSMPKCETLPTAKARTNVKRIEPSGPERQVKSAPSYSERDLSRGKQTAPRHL